VSADSVRLIEKSGVNVFQLNQEPTLINHCDFDWVIEVMSKDKRLLNQIMSKIQIRQTYQQFAD
jgi:hypothetical protein